MTMSSLYNQRQRQQSEVDDSEEVDPLPDGICVSKFGPISRRQQNRQAQVGAEPRAVTANIGQSTRPTISVRQPLASASPLPDGLMIMQDQFSVLNYDPGNIDHNMNTEKNLNPISYFQML